jgi:hypothetical protein
MRKFDEFKRPLQPDEEKRSEILALRGLKQLGSSLGLIAKDIEDRAIDRDWSIMIIDGRFWELLRRTTLPKKIDKHIDWTDLLDQVAKVYQLGLVSSDLFELVSARIRDIISQIDATVK